MLLKARKNFVPPQRPIWKMKKRWLLKKKTIRRMCPQITTHSAYSFAVNTRIVPYFREKGIYLKDLQPKHLHYFYQYVLKGFGLTTNTVLHYHANIRQALQYAFEMDMIPSNPADKVKRLKKNQFIGRYYTSD
ncbi:phage integrase SAM-like domain-containing protein [Paenibacillus oralis]|uniref:phage integrase SAM-like domain-containing protein n=1 Tax=Paenibacillus oralis TaxID=2490856 RepID=UPI001C498622|nr:phage integrase SAM-like domain-containing protein [Paenibacillus oralis]